MRHCKVVFAFVNVAGMLPVLVKFLLKQLVPILATGKIKFVINYGPFAFKGKRK